MTEISSKVKRRIRKLEYECDDLRRKVERLEAEVQQKKIKLEEIRSQQNLNNFNDGGI